MHQWRAMVEYLSNSLAVGSKWKSALAQHLTLFDTWEIEEMNLHIRLVRVTKCFRSDSKKLWISLNEAILIQERTQTISLRRAVFAAISELDGIKSVSGRAPPGHMERELSDLVTRLDAMRA